MLSAVIRANGRTEALAATLSVLNIFDRDPSFARLDYNYDPFTGSALGRNFKVGLSKKF